MAGACDYATILANSIYQNADNNDDCALLQHEIVSGLESKATMDEIKMT